MTTTHAFVLIFVLAFWVGEALFAGWIADFKGRRFWVYAIATLIVGPLVLLISLLLPRPREVRDAEESGTPPGNLPPRWKQFTGVDD